MRRQGRHGLKEVHAPGAERDRKRQRDGRTDGIGNAGKRKKGGSLKKLRQSEHVATTGATHLHNAITSKAGLPALCLKIGNIDASAVDVFRVDLSSPSAARGTTGFVLPHPQETA